MLMALVPSAFYLCAKGKKVKGKEGMERGTQRYESKQSWKKEEL